MKKRVYSANNFFFSFISNKAAAYNVNEIMLAIHVPFFVFM